MSASSTPGQPLPPNCLPERLESLGFVARKFGDIEVIVPPVVSVPAGEFLMGSDKRRDEDANDDELPQHSVTLLAYQIDRFPVTVAEYACFVRAGQAEPHTWQSQLEHPDHPVAYVSWRDARAYAAWLANVTGDPWRLPSEAEWERAARWDAEKRSARLYAWGDAWDVSRCNSGESGVGAPTPVGSYPTGASPAGALDMTGNVWEWTSSLVRPYPYQQDDGREDPTAPGNRVLRGGAWVSDEWYCRAACRWGGHPDGFRGSRGFRMVLAAPGT